MINIIFIVLYVIMTVSGLILFKLGSNSSQIEIISKGILNIQISFISFIGIFCYLCSFIIYLILISKNTLSFFIPFMTGIVYVSVLITSVIIFKEKITFFSIIGSIFILLGVIMIVYKGK